MIKIIHLIVTSIIFLTLSACQSQSLNNFSPEYEITQHELIDQIWSVADQKIVTRKDLSLQLAKSNIILLGETHDNARHHQLQAQVITELTNSLNNIKHSPIVAFEMLNQNKQAAINQFQSQYYSPADNTTQLNSAKKVELFSQRINWEKSGWPEWEYYYPIFYSSIDNELPIIAANLNIKTIRNVIKQGSIVLDQQYQDLLTKYQYDEPLKKELMKEILSSHCDMLPEKMLSPMLLGQQVRDLAMTQSILSSLPKKTVPDKMNQLILIAGSGHTRTDYGVPYYLHQEAPELKIVSLAFMEVSKGEFNPTEYAKAWSETAEKLPFDYIWFTETAAREDQCKKMREYMKKKKNKK